MNVLYLHMHDMGRYNSLYGHAIRTPNLESVAQDGTVFTQAFCAGPTCSPSRGALLTGLYPHSNGLIGLASLHVRRRAQNRGRLARMDSGRDTGERVGRRGNLADARWQGGPPAVPGAG